MGDDIIVKIVPTYGSFSAWQKAARLEKVLNGLMRAPLGPLELLYFVALCWRSGTVTTWGHQRG
jgi:hypothetical protein